MKPFINRYNWKGINYPSGKDDKKIFRQIILQLLLMCYVLKMSIYFKLIYFKTQLKSWKTNHSFNDSKPKRMALSCSEKHICLIKKNNFKTCWWFWLPELFSLASNKKQACVSWKYTEIRFWWCFNAFWRD